MNPKSKALNAIKTGSKKVGRFLNKNFVEPSVNYNKAQKLKDMKARESALKEQTGEL